MKNIVFFDVDTQYSFMHKNGKFYVKGAEKIIPNLKKITQFASVKKISVIATIDKHGHEKITETILSNSASVPNKKLENKSIEELMEKNRLLIEKKKHDVFSNPNTRNILKNVKKAFVYGVATDYCVKAAVLGLRKMNIETYVVKDAIKPAFLKNEKKVLNLFMKKGAKFLTTSQLLSRRLQDN